MNKKRNVAQLREYTKSHGIMHSLLLPLPSSTCFYCTQRSKFNMIFFRRSAETLCLAQNTREISVFPFTIYVCTCDVYFFQPFRMAWCRPLCMFALWMQTYSASAAQQNCVHHFLPLSLSLAEFLLIFSKWRRYFSCWMQCEIPLVESWCCKRRRAH